MYCSNCGTNNPSNSVFCSNCGSPFTGVPVSTPKKTNKWIIIVPVIILVLVLIVVLSGSSEKYVGTWNCKGYSTASGPSGSYMITMVLKSNGEYTFGQYGDLDNNHSKGTFTAKYEEEKKSTGRDFYLLDFQNEEFIVNGQKDNGTYTMNLEMEFIRNREALIVNAKNYAMYYCYK